MPKFLDVTNATAARTALGSTAIGSEVWTAPDASAARAALNLQTVFSTADYPQGAGGDDRPRVLAAIDAAVSAIASTGLDQVVVIHAPMVFKTGYALPGITGLSRDPVATMVRNKQGVPLPVNLPAKLNIVFADGAKITLTENCQTAFCIRKIADYDVFQNVNFYNAWVDGDNIPRAGAVHGLIGNTPTSNTPQYYMSFQDINFYGKTRITNMYANNYQDRSNPNDPRGQVGIMFIGSHVDPLEETETFSKNIYLEDGEQIGGSGLFNVCAVGQHVGGVNHYHDNIVVGTYRYIVPVAPTNWHNQTGIFVCGAGYGDYCYIGPGYVENCGDDSIEIGAMQRADIVAPRSKDAWLVGILIRHTHRPINPESQLIHIRGMQSKVTTALTGQSTALTNTGIPISIAVDNQVVDLTSTATGGTFTLTVPGKGTTAALNYNATAAQVASALVAIGCTSSRATGGPLNVAPITAWIGIAVLRSATTANSSLTGGTITVSLSDQNASVGNIIIDDLVAEFEGLRYSHMDPGNTIRGILVNGLDFPIKKIELNRPKIVVSDLVYDYTGNRELTLLNPKAPFSGWGGNFIVRDYELKMQGNCQLQNGSNVLFFNEILVEGNGTQVEVDGMISDRAATNGTGYNSMICTAKTSGSSGLKIKARNLNPKTMSLSGWSGSYRGTIVSTGQESAVEIFDVSDSDFSVGVGGGFEFAHTGTSSALRTQRNRYKSVAADQVLGAYLDPLTATISTAVSLQPIKGRFTFLLSSGAAAPTLPSAVGNESIFTFVNKHSSTLTINSSSSQTIDGAASLPLSAGDSVTLISDGANWKTPANRRGVANGYASLDAVSRLPVAQLPETAVTSVAGKSGPTVTLSPADLSSVTATGVSLVTATDPSAARTTIGVAYGTTAGTVAQGNDSRIIGAQPKSERGVALGYASLDADGRVPTAQLPATAFNVLTTTGAWLPADCGYVAWSYDPLLMNNLGYCASGTVHLIGVRIPYNTTITNVHLWVSLGDANTVSGQCFAGLYQGGNLLAATASQHTAWQSAGLKTMALSTPQSVTTGLAYVAILYKTSGSEVIRFGRTALQSDNFFANAGLTSNFRFATADTGVTSLPSSYSTPAASGATTFWVGVS